MMVEPFIRRLEKFGSQDVIVGRGISARYSELVSEVDRLTEYLSQDMGVGAGDLVALTGDIDPGSISALLALSKLACIVVPIWNQNRSRYDPLLAMAGASLELSFSWKGTPLVKKLGYRRDDALYKILRKKNAPGLIVFSSGSSGRPKGIVHDLSLIFKKFDTRRPQAKTLAFLLFDHLGGVNTLLHTLLNGGCLVTIPDRTPETVMNAIKRYDVGILPTSPSFLNLLLLCDFAKEGSFPSLKLITYGTEPMPEVTLKRIHALLPHVRLQQTYGLSELAVLRSKSESSESLWLKIGGNGFQTRVVDDILQIKADSTMLGYLNAPSPFTEDGSFITGDLVEQKGEYIRFLGRISEVIIVGGEKVYPAEVEGVLHGIDNITQAAVYAEMNPLLGQIVCAEVVLQAPEEPDQARIRIKKICKQLLAPYKIPVKIRFVKHDLMGTRLKKTRSSGENTECTQY